MKDQAEIIVVDNGSTDDTDAILQGFHNNEGVKLRLLHESKPGKSHALNCGVVASYGLLLAFTDDDCRLHEDYVSQALAYDSEDKSLVLRGGKIELGDHSDLPITINLYPKRKSWNRKDGSAKTSAMAGKVNGCNMTMRREVVSKIGFFDEDFGPGGRMISGDDTEYIYRAYRAGITIEHVPDMGVYHYHGRKTAHAAFNLWRNYTLGNGAIMAKYLFLHPDLCKPFWWDIKGAFRELLTGTNMMFPEFGFSHRNKVFYQIIGLFRYAFRFPR